MKSNTRSDLCRSEDSLLLIIDIQTKLTNIMPINVLARLKRNTTLLIRSADLLKIPVIASAQYPKGLGPVEPEITEILPGDTTIYEKTCFSCADTEPLMETLGKSGKQQVILAGMEAHICVLQTALDLYSAGFAVFVATDGICSRNRENYENALQRMQHAGIVTASSESIIFEWLKDAGHDQFKAISSMIK